MGPLASSPARVDPGPDFPARDLANLSGVLNLSASSCSDISQLEISLEEAEDKIVGLLKVKEKLVLVQVSSLPCSITTFQLHSYISGREVPARAGCLPAGGRAVDLGCGKQESYGLYCHSHHR